MSPAPLADPSVSWLPALSSGPWRWILLLLFLLLLLGAWLLLRRARRHQRVDPRIAQRIIADGSAEEAALAAPEWLVNAMRQRPAPQPTPQPTATVVTDARAAAATAPAFPSASEGPVARVTPAMPVAPLVAPAEDVPREDASADEEPVDLLDAATPVTAISSFALSPRTAPDPHDDATAVPEAPRHAPATPTAAPAAAPPLDAAPFPHEPAGDQRPAAASAFAQARRLAAQDRPRDALVLLRPALDARAPASAWATAGWCAWKLAQREADPLPMSGEAIRAFDHALAADPSRRTPLSRMIGRCHLLRASADVPGQRPLHLAAAAQAYEQAFAGDAPASSAGLLEWANALAALATQGIGTERAGWLAQLDQVRARAAATATTPAWCRLHAQSAWLHAAAAPSSAARAHLHAQAVAHLQHGYAQLADASARDAWLAESIDAERGYLQTLSHAARANAHAELAARVRGALESSTSAAPWLAWVHVLAASARDLQRPAARQRLAEADAVFARLANAQARVEEQQGIQFARAYYLRLRAAFEPAPTRQQTQAEAARLLAALQDSDFPAPASVILEQAELALLQASDGDGDDAATHLARAVAHASTAADTVPLRVPAFRLLLVALQRWQAVQPDENRLAQVALVAQWLREADAPPSADSLRLLATAALLADDMGEATRLSAAAWDAGADSRDLLAVWQQADGAWANQLGSVAERDAWERQHRRLRLALGTC